MRESTRQRNNAWFDNLSHHSTTSFLECTLQGVHHTHGTGWVRTHNHISTVAQTNQRVDIRLMGMSRERIDEENQCTKVFHAHERGDLSVSAERTRGAGQTILNLRVFFARFGEHREIVLSGQRYEDTKVQDRRRCSIAATNLPSPHKVLHIRIVVWVPVMRNFMRISEYVWMNSFLWFWREVHMSARSTTNNKIAGDVYQTYMAGFMWLCATRASWRISDGTNFDWKGNVMSSVAESISAASSIFSSCDFGIKVDSRLPRFWSMPIWPRKVLRDVILVDVCVKLV